MFGLHVDLPCQACLTLAVDEVLVDDQLGSVHMRGRAAGLGAKVRHGCFRGRLGGDGGAGDHARDARCARGVDREHAAVHVEQDVGPAVLNRDAVHRLAEAHRHLVGAAGQAEGQVQGTHQLQRRAVHAVPGFGLAQDVLGQADELEVVHRAEGGDRAATGQHL